MLGGVAGWSAGHALGMYSAARCYYSMFSTSVVERMGYMGGLYK